MFITSCNAKNLPDRLCNIDNAFIYPKVYTHPYTQFGMMPSGITVSPSAWFVERTGRDDAALPFAPGVSERRLACCLFRPAVASRVFQDRGIRPCGNQPPSADNQIQTRIATAKKWTNRPREYVLGPLRLVVTADVPGIFDFALRRRDETSAHRDRLHHMTPNDPQGIPAAGL